MKSDELKKDLSQVYNETTQELTINNHIYKLFDQQIGGDISNLEAVEILVAFYTSAIAKCIDEYGNLSLEFMAHKDYNKVRNMILNIISYEDNMLIKNPNHFMKKEFKKDYIPLIANAISVLCAPFLPEKS